MEEKEKCPNGCGCLEVANGHIEDNKGKTYFKVDIHYCPECYYISYVSARL